MWARRTFLGSLICLPLWASKAWGGGTKPKLYLFNIPAQPLQSALIAYAQIVGTQILYDARTAQGRRGHAVVGLFTADTALRSLISDTDLTILSGGGDAVLVPVAELRAKDPAGEAEASGTTLVLDTLHVDLPPGSDQRPDFSEYGRLVRGRLLHAVMSDNRTAQRIYKLRLGITITPKGVVGIDRVTQSSGSASVIDALEKVINAVVIDSPPPEGMPLPIYLTIIGI